MNISKIEIIRDIVTLISKINIIFSGVDDENTKKNIIESISISRNVDFEVDWKDNFLQIMPKSNLDELTKYELQIGDDINLSKKRLEFITGPYPYFSPEFFIRPEHWSICFRINADGIPEVYYSHIDRWESNTVTIAQYALACYDDYIKNNNENSKDIFMKQVKFLSKNNHEIGIDKIAYPYFFPFNGLQPPWYSGMAQGQVVSVFVRAFIIADDESYLDIARKIINFMFVPVDCGGVFTFTPEGHDWIEEYPTTPPSFVWNGFVFAVMGLIDYNKICPSHELNEQINKFIVSIKQTINVYDTGKELYYERENKKICNLMYIGIQTFQVKHMFLSTKDIFFDELYKKWKTYFKYDDTFLSLFYTPPRKLGFMGKLIRRLIPKKIKIFLKKLMNFK